MEDMGDNLEGKTVFFPLEHTTVLLRIPKTFVHYLSAPQAGEASHQIPNNTYLTFGTLQNLNTFYM